MKNLLFIGLILIFIGFILILSSQDKTNVKTAGGIFLGPIPIFGFGSDRKLIYLMFIIGIIIYVLFELFRRLN